MEPRRLTFRHTVMWARTALLAAVVAGLTACTGGGSVGAPSTPTPGATVTESPSTNAVVSTLVGYPSQPLKCPTRPTREPDQSQVAVTGQVRAYLLCPLEPGVWGPPFSPYRLTTSAPSGGKPFAALDAALRLPDEPPSGEACPATAQAPRTILIETGEGLWGAHLPVDGCGMYLPQVVNALSEIAVPL